MTSLNEHESCCPVIDDPAAPSLEEMMDDPTMAQCCIRDMKRQQKSAALRAQLQKVDISTQRQKAAQQVLGSPLPESESPSSNFGGDDDENEAVDPELMRLRELRLQQLKVEADMKQQLQKHGYGKLNDHQESATYDFITSKESPVVCHVAVTGLQACDQLDEYLEVKAHAHQHIYFCRTAITRESKLRHQLGLEQVPVLVIVKNGRIIGRSPLSMFGAVDQIYEEQVDGYLQRLGLLDTASRDGASSDHERSEEEGDWEAPCEVCGRRYPHQHVKAVYASNHAAHDSGTESD